LSTDFEGFYDYDDRMLCKDFKDTEWVGFRSEYHSFWHDDPTQASMREKHDRRIKRFLEIDATSEPVLFVRAVAETDEINRAEELLELL